MDLMISSDDHDPPTSFSVADDRVYVNLADGNIIPAIPNPLPPPHNNVLLLSDSQLLDAMEAELRLAYKMVEELKQAPRHKKSYNSRSRRGLNGNGRRSGSSEAMALNIAKPCCFCSSTTTTNAAMASHETMMTMSINGSDQFPSPDSTAQMRSATSTPPRRSSSFSSSTSSSSPSSSRRLLLSSSNLTVAQKLFDTRMETVSTGLNPDGLMLAVDKFLSSPNYS